MNSITSTLTLLASSPPPSHHRLPPDVSAELQRWFRYLLWIIEFGLIARILAISGKAGWEHFRPPPGPPDAPGDIIRALLAWSMAATAFPLAANLLIDPLR
ncbi:MAG: hypothetical protein J2P17_00120 [Mycobacterium sp.]|nr:hypothetical protein [Mycobacterium sp.]